MKKLNLRHKIQPASTKLSKPILGVLAVVLIITVYFAIQISSLGATLVDLENNNKKLSDENLKLTSEIMKSGSLSQASEKAEELGFSGPSRVIYLSREDSVAKLP